MSEAIVVASAPVARLAKLARHGVFAAVPGVSLTAGVAGLAFALRRIPGVAVLSPMILATLVGMALHNIFGTPAWAKPGVTFSLKRVLRLGIILLGLQLMASQVVQVGFAGVGVIAAALVATLSFTKWLGRVMGVDAKLAELIGAGTSICGASAVIATNTVTRGTDEDVAYAVACVTVFGLLSMLLYPLLPGLLHLSPAAFGLWSGASIHEIAQVVAAAFQDGTHSGEIATVAKLTRVMMLAPVVITLGISRATDCSRHRPVRFPPGAAHAMVRAGLHRHGDPQQRRHHPGRPEGHHRPRHDLHALHGAGRHGYGDGLSQAAGRGPQTAGFGRSGMDLHLYFCARAGEA
jgi:uncharacterized integral membrane protein (TIGR00698 family)